jgi:hypothetical protein
MSYPEKENKKPRKYLIVNPNAPQIDHSLQVKLPNGKFNSVNVFQYNLCSAVHETAPEKWVTIELDDGSWIQVGNLTPVFDEEC